MAQAAAEGANDRWDFAGTRAAAARRCLPRQQSLEHALARDVALPAVDMQMARTEATAQHLPQSRGDADLATDICVMLLIGGLDALTHARSDVARTAGGARLGGTAAPGLRPPATPKFGRLRSRRRAPALKGQPRAAGRRVLARLGGGKRAEIWQARTPKKQSGP